MLLKTIVFAEIRCQVMDKVAVCVRTVKNMHNHKMEATSEAAHNVERIIS